MFTLERSGRLVIDEHLVAVYALTIDFDVSANAGRKESQLHYVFWYYDMLRYHLRSKGIADASLQFRRATCRQSGSDYSS